RPATRRPAPPGCGRRGPRACGSCRNRRRRGAGRRGTPRPCAAPRRARTRPARPSPAQRRSRGPAPPRPAPWGTARRPRAIARLIDPLGIDDLLVALGGRAVGGSAGGLTGLGAGLLIDQLAQLVAGLLQRLQLGADLGRVL